MAKDRLAVMLLGLHAVSGCAREALPPEVPGMPELEGAPTAGETPRPRVTRRGFESLTIPPGDACLAQLETARVAFEVLADTPGVKTPVAVKGPIGGVEYVTTDRSPLVCDCRLAVTLDRVSNELSALGVTRVRYSGAYVYRTQRNGRPSLHAEGLAIDLHEFVVGADRFAVVEDYRRGAECSPSLPVPNRLACELARTGFFEEIITPDDNRDHHDHLHLAIAPL